MSKWQKNSSTENVDKSLSCLEVIWNFQFSGEGHVADILLGAEGLPGELFSMAPNSEMHKVLDGALDLARRTPAILAQIDQDQDVVALHKKAMRRADAQWRASHTACLPGLVLPEATDSELQVLPLEQGRPRMPAEVAYVFFVLQGYVGSLTDRGARDLLRESQTVHAYLQSRGQSFPGWSTILENVNAISVATRSSIMDAQLAALRQDGLDDFSEAVVDSTAVRANSAWPTDGRTLLGLLGRAFRASQKLSDFGLPNLPKHWVPRWLDRLQGLLFRINICGGKRHATRNRKKYYRQLLQTALKVLAHLLPHSIQRDPLDEVSLPPSQQALLSRLWEGLRDDLISACAVYDYTHERIFEDKTRPANDKLLSLGDPSASFIEKGGREPVIGYKPQLARSANGFVTGLIVNEGNDADSTQLAPIVDQIMERTGVCPAQVTADDGYAVQEVRDQLLADGVEKVILCGSKARAFTAEDEWDSVVHQAARRARSAVESLVFVLKSMFGFGRLRRRGLEAVRAELLAKVVAHNFYRAVLLRGQAQAEARKAA